jgi:hypothetical protein
VSGLEVEPGALCRAAVQTLVRRELFRILVRSVAGLQVLAEFGVNNTR